MSNFRLAAKSIHLTYRTHVDFERLRSFIVARIGSLKWWSIVHENGHGATADPESTNPYEGEDDRGYEHTHFAFECHNKVQTRNARFFDFEGIHCHIRTIDKPVHAQRIFHLYHLKEPVRIEQSSTGNEPAPIVSDTGDAVKRIKKATNLMEAAALFGITPTSITDIAAIRNERTRPPPAEHSHPNTTWTVNVYDGWRVVYMWGSSNTGKTTWAVHQFERPLLISELDELRYFDKDVYDGIIFDDVSFHNCTTESLIHILDWDFTRNIRCRYYNATIPAHTRKIICSNKHWGELFRIEHTEQREAVYRRISQVVHVTGPTYILRTSPVLEDIPEDAGSDRSDDLEETAAIDVLSLMAQANDEIQIESEISESDLENFDMDMFN